MMSFKRIWTRSFLNNESVSFLDKRTKKVDKRLLIWPLLSTNQFVLTRLRTFIIPFGKLILNILSLMIGQIRRNQLESSFLLAISLLILHVIHLLRHFQILSNLHSSFLSGNLVSNLSFFCQTERLIFFQNHKFLNLSLAFLYVRLKIFRLYTSSSLLLLFIVGILRLLRVAIRLSRLLIRIKMWRFDILWLDLWNLLWCLHFIDQWRDKNGIF